MSTVCSTGSVRNRTVSFEKYFIKVTFFFGEFHLIELGFVKFNEEKKNQCQCFVKSFMCKMNFNTKKNEK